MTQKSIKRSDPLLPGVVSLIGWGGDLFLMGWGGDLFIRSMFHLQLKEVIENVFFDFIPAAPPPYSLPSQSENRYWSKYNCYPPPNSTALVRPPFRKSGFYNEPKYTGKKINFDINGYLVVNKSEVEAKEEKELTEKTAYLKNYCRKSGLKCIYLNRTFDGSSEERGAFSRNATKTWVEEGDLPSVCRAAPLLYFHLSPFDHLYCSVSEVRHPSEVHHLHFITILRSFYCPVTAYMYTLPLKEAIPFI